MKQKAVLFDLDGTLLPMDQSLFLRSYFRALAAYMVPHGYDPSQLPTAILKATEAMLKNNGEKTNEDRFFDAFALAYPDRAVREDIPRFDAFYRTDFEKIRQLLGFTPRAAEAIRYAKQAGATLVLATNPVFPRVATEARIAWAGLDANDFCLITSYENTHHAKPNPSYYREIADRIGLAPEQCLMVGNDTQDDMIAQSIGMQVFLLTDCLINPSDTDINAFPHGDFDTLIAAMDAFLHQDLKENKENRR